MSILSVIMAPIVTSGQSWLEAACGTTGSTSVSWVGSLRARPCRLGPALGKNSLGLLIKNGYFQKNAKNHMGCNKTSPPKRRWTLDLQATCEIVRKTRHRVDWLSTSRSPLCLGSKQLVQSSWAWAFRAESNESFCDYQRPQYEWQQGGIRHLTTCNLRLTE